MTRDDRVRLISRWGDVPLGAVGRVVRSYADPGGRRWVRVEWCRTLDGRPVRCTYPAGVLAPSGASRAGANRSMRDDLRK